jgi:hypothetical protein
VGPVLTPAPPQQAPTRLGRDIALIATGAVLAVALILGVLAAVRSPGYVDHVTIANPTQYAVDVYVTSGDGHSRVALGQVAPGDRHAFSTVVDQGDRWVVHVSSADTDGGTIAVSRSNLERHNWAVTIPDQVATKLTAGGAIPKPATQ